MPVTILYNPCRLFRIGENWNPVRFCNFQRSHGWLIGNFLCVLNVQKVLRTISHLILSATLGWVFYYYYCPAVGEEEKPHGKKFSHNLPRFTSGERSTEVPWGYSWVQSGPKAGHLHVILCLLEAELRLGILILKPAKNICCLVPIIIMR